MSQSARYQYRLQAEERRRLYLQRIRKNTLQYLSNHREKFERLRQHGYMEWLHDEFQEISREFDVIEQLVQRNPEEARDRNIRLGDRLYRIPYIAEAARRMAEKRARQEKGQTKVWLFEQMSKVKDPVVRDFAYEELANLRAEAEHLSSADLESWKAETQSRLEEAIVQAREKAEAWKQEQRQKAAKSTREDRLQVVREQVEALGSTPSEQHDAARKGMQQLTQLASVSGADVMNDDDFEDALAQQRELLEQAQLEEDCRRQVVRQLMAALMRTGFQVQTPKRRLADGKDEVILRARKPSGSRAMVRVDTEGTMFHKFDRYEGSTCKEDIELVHEQLEAIYGISLSEERIVWENPDRLSADSRLVGAGAKGDKHG